MPRLSTHCNMRFRIAKQRRKELWVKITFAIIGIGLSYGLAVATIHWIYP